MGQTINSGASTLVGDVTIDNTSTIPVQPPADIKTTMTNTSVPAGKKWIVLGGWAGGRGDSVGAGYIYITLTQNGTGFKYVNYATADSDLSSEIYGQTQTNNTPVVLLNSTSDSVSFTSGGNMDYEGYGISYIELDEQV